MLNIRNFASLPVIFAGLTISNTAFATNGMNLEGYGPIAHSMGGASMAYDNGTAAVINNPATLGLMKDNSSRLDLAVGLLGPDIEASVGGLTANSSGDAYYMPAIGWAKRQDKYTYGFGVFGQGGMGTEYSASSWMGDPSNGANTALSQRLTNRAELSVGRLMLPLTFQANNKLIIGGSVDLVWAGLDLQMALSEAQFVDMATPSVQTIGSASGTLVDGFGAWYEPFGGEVVPSSGRGISKLHHAYFDFSNSSDYSGKANATGYAAKLGMTYQINPKLSFGATYHSKTKLNNLETSDATLSMAVNADFDGVGGNPYADVNIPVSGKMSVNNFQWPEIYALGIAYQANDRLMIAVDTKYIGWADVMKNFDMTFTADGTQANPLAAGFANAVLDATLFQSWESQTTLQLGATYEYSEQVSLRGGLNYAKNPVPDQYVNALFPATTEKHLTAGIGYAVDDNNEVNFSLSFVPEISTTNPGNGSTIPPVTTTHSQLSWQLMYSRIL